MGSSKQHPPSASQLKVICALTPALTGTAQHRASATRHRALKQFGDFLRSLRRRPSGQSSHHGQLDDGPMLGVVRDVAVLASVQTAQELLTTDAEPLTDSPVEVLPSLFRAQPADASVPTGAAWRLRLLRLLRCRGLLFGCSGRTGRSGRVTALRGGSHVACPRRFGTTRAVQARALVAVSATGALPPACPDVARPATVGRHCGRATLSPLPGDRSGGGCEPGRGGGGAPGD